MAMSKLAVPEAGRRHLDVRSIDAPPAACCRPSSITTRSARGGRSPVRSRRRACSGPYAIEWPPTEFGDDVLGRLGGVFRGTVMQFDAGTRLLRRRRVLAAARRRSDRADGARGVLHAETADGRRRHASASRRPVSRKARAGAATTSDRRRLGARAAVAEDVAGGLTMLFIITLFAAAICRDIVCPPVRRGTAQQHDHAAADDARPVTLLEGLGTSVHHPIATRNAEAQKFFDQGLTLIYAFNHEEAIRSFQQGRRARPEVADAALGHRLGARPEHQPRRRSGAREGGARRGSAGAQAGRLGARPTSAPTSTRSPSATRTIRRPISRRWRVNTRTRCGGWCRRYPDDLDAATLYAESLMNLHPWQLWALDGTPDRGHRSRSSSVLESVLRRESESRRRQSLLHPRGRGLAGARPRAAEREEARDAGAGRRPSGPHAGAHLHAHRRLRRRGHRQRARRRSRSRLHRGDQAPAASIRRCTTTTTSTSWRRRR